MVSKEDAWRSLSERWTFLKWPILRGTIVLIESLINGIQALNFSANQALEGEEDKNKSLNQWAIIATMITALALGMGLFVALPHLLTMYSGKLFGARLDVNSLWFHAIDGFIKIFFFWAYIKLISLHGDIRRIFQYHGAEHKAVSTYENGEELTVENARKYSPLHPRCGTSFILLVLLISMVFFALAFPFVPRFSGMNSVVRNAIYIGCKILFMLPIAGIAYEMIRWGSKKMNLLPVRMIMAPGIWLQKLTTRHPTDDQLEVALNALDRVIKLEGFSKPREELQ